MKIAIFGLGYVGCTAAGCLASQGHKVVGVDVAEGKVATINAGLSPVAEPGLSDLIRDAVAKGHLYAVREIGDELADCDLAFVCVGTPSQADGAHDMRYIASVTRSIARAIDPARKQRLTVAYRSTMRPGSTQQLIVPQFRGVLGDSWAEVVELVYNPEFLREASAIDDFFSPPKIVVGTHDGSVSETMARLNEGIDAQVFYTGLGEAEMTKFVDNTWHALKVGFANEIGRICQLSNVDVRKVHEVFVSDTKLNISAAYTKPGDAFGGSCLPKDVRALQHIAAETGANSFVVDALLRSNEAHKAYLFSRVTNGLAPGARLLLVGLAFKNGTDDLRESPAVDMASKLLNAGYHLEVYDPALRTEQLVGQNLGYAFSSLPNIESLLVSKERAEAGEYDLIVATNRLVDTIDTGNLPVVDISKFA